MGKNKKMLEVFFKVMKNEENTINKLIPNSYQKNIFTIDYKALLKNGYDTILFDIDNTIMPINDIEVTRELKKLFIKLSKQFTICLVSNNKEKRVEPVAKKLKTLYISCAHKPEKEAFAKALRLTKKNKENIVLIGDQLLSDIYGGNEFGLYTILVDPFKNKYDIKTGVNHILQNILMKRLKDKIKKHTYF